MVSYAKLMVNIFYNEFYYIAFSLYVVDLRNERANALEKWIEDNPKNPLVHDMEMMAYED